MRKINIELKLGEHGLLAGQNGSGKTMLAAWLIRYAKTRSIVFDTKAEPVFLKLPKSGNDEHIRIVHTVSEMISEAKNHRTGADYIIVRPPIEVVAEPFELDEYLYAIYENLTGFYTFIDEAYQFHRGAQAGKGYIGLLTRGRARGLSTLVATQRPAWISRFSFTETKKFYIFKLSDKKDWQRVGDIIPDIPKEGVKLKPYHFLYYEQGEDNYELIMPVNPISDVGFTPQVEDASPRRKWY